jgi:ribosomal protein S14
MRKKINYDFSRRQKYVSKKISLCLWKALQESRIIIQYPHRTLLAFKLGVFRQLKHPKNFCILTGRSKGVFRAGHLSRNLFKSSVNTGHLYGYRKVSF